MAFTISRAKVLRALVKTETTDGTDSTPAGGTDDLLCYTNENPFEQTADEIQFDPIGGTFTKRAPQTGPQLGEIALEYYMMGSGSAGVSAVNGFAAIDALMLASGHKCTVVTSTSLTYAPATIAQIDTPSGTSPRSGPATIKVEKHGVLHQGVGCWGNLILTGNPKDGLKTNFNGMGRYVAPTVAAISGWTGGGTRQLAFKGVSGTITRSGGSAYTYVGHSFKFDAGCDIQRVEDFNSSTGLNRILFANRRPTIEIVLALDADGSAAETYAQLYSDMVAKTSIAIAWVLGSTAGNTLTFSSATAKISKLVGGTEMAHRTVTVTFAVVSDTNEADYSLVMT